MIGFLKMGSRTRSRVLAAIAGGSYTVYTAFGGHVTTNGSGGNTITESNDDVTMSPPYVVDHTLVITKRSSVPWVLNGTLPMSYPYNRAEYHDYVFASRSLAAYSPTLPVFNSNYWKTKALANLNPYSPKMDLPLFLFELKDLPRMIRDAGYLLSKQWNRLWRTNDPGSAYLAYQFGWRALYSDLLSMLDFVKQTDNRMAYLKALEQGSHFRRMLFSGVTEDADGADVTLSHPIDGSKIVIDTQRMLTREKIWFTANAQLVDPLPLTGVSARQQAFNLVYGTGPFQLFRIWDFLPWTWLSDYFVNIGDYLEAYDTLTRVKVTRMNLMATRSRWSQLRPRYVASGLTHWYSELRTTEKRRIVYVNPVPTLGFTPFLTEGQVAVLGALYATGVIRKVRPLAIREFGGR